MKHIDLNSEREAVKDFFLSLPADPHGSLIELNGRALARVTPVNDTAEPSEESAEAEPTLECKWSSAPEDPRRGPGL